MRTRRVDEHIYMVRRTERKTDIHLKVHIHIYTDRKHPRIHSISDTYTNPINPSLPFQYTHTQTRKPKRQTVSKNIHNKHAHINTHQGERTHQHPTQIDDSPRAFLAQPRIHRTSREKKHTENNYRLTSQTYIFIVYSFSPPPFSPTPPPHPIFK